MTLRLIPARELGLIDDKPADELPARPAFETVDECANCAANAATIAVLRAEVQRLRALIDDLRLDVTRMTREAWAAEDLIATLRAERLTLAERAAVLEADELGRDEAPRSGAADDIALRLVASEQETGR